MKRIIVWALLLAMLLGMFAGCGANQPQATDPTTQDPTVATPVADDNLAGAIAYLKAMYKEVTESTPADFQRTNVVRVAGEPYEVVWTVDVAEDLVKIIPGEKSVTVDVNEEVTEDTPYVLTATITGTDGNTASASWNHFMPASLGSDFGAIIDMAYALEDGQALDNVATLTGVITSIDTPYDAGYKNITVTIQVEGREDKPIQCYRLKGEGAEDLWTGDTITVTGTLKNYKGTIEFDAGCELKEVVKGENEKPVAPEDPAEIVKAAYSLQAGESLPYTATLTGRVVFVDTAYSAQYDNVTVTIAVGDKPIKCFRIKGPDSDTLNINDVITVTGTLMNYNGFIEFASGSSLDNVEQHEAPKAPADQTQIVDEAYALNPGEYLNYRSVLTGIVIQVVTPYNPQYFNVTVKMVVAGREDKPITCYRMAGYGVENVGVGDTISVQGTLYNRMGTSVQFGQAIMVAHEKGDPSDVPELPEIQYPEADSTLSIAEAAALGAKMDHDTTTPGKYYVTGTIQSIASTTWGNMTITDGNGNTLYLYGTYDTDGNRYDKMETKPVVGDTITVYGVIGNYNGAQMKNATFVTGDNTPSEPEEPVVPSDPAAGSTLTIEQALTLGASKDHNVYTTGKYYVTGVITEVYNTTYGNMYIKDAAGNILTVYGTYSADGSDRYDKMETKPVAGDTVTVYGVVGQYNSVPQIKNAWITAHSAAGDTTEPSEPSDPEVPTLNSNSTAAEILAACKAAEKGTYFEGVTVTISGTVTWAGTPSTKRGDVTFSLDNGLEVYRLKCDVFDKIAVGDTVTVSGTPGNRSTTNGTPGLKDATLISWSGDSTTEPETPALTGFAAQVEAAKALANNQYLEESSNVTGIVTNIAKYNESYHSYNFTLDVNGVSIYCYSLNADKALTLEVGDSVTVNGYLTAYNGTPQFEYKKSTMVINKTPALTGFAAQVEAAKALANNQYLEESSNVTGIVTNIAKYNESYHSYNFTLDVNGVSIYCYSLNADKALTLEVGDSVTVNGYLTAYNGTPQFEYKKSTMIINKSAESETPEAPTLNEGSSAAEILAACKAAEKGYYFDGVTVTISGTVTWAGTPSTNRGDVTFSLDNGLEVYRLKCDVFDKIAVGDTVTVSGTPGNRSTTNGTPGLKDCTLVSWVDNT